MGDEKFMKTNTYGDNSEKWSFDPNSYGCQGDKQNADQREAAPVFMTFTMKNHTFWTYLEIKLIEIDI